MRKLNIALLTVSCLTLASSQTHRYNKQVVERSKEHRGYSNSFSYEEQPYADDTAAAATQARRPIYNDENYPIQNAIPVPLRAQQRPQPIPVAVAPRRPPGPSQQFRQQVDEERIKENREETEDEKEEPDRLSLLLPQSKFDCVGKNTGYYADEILNCEVFHYCQDNVKHSWICPEGFTFHQVHLICMPPGADNICEKSSQYHFVNEYLYKPVNLEEHQRKPNVSLKYSERFYPNNNYRNDDYEDDEAPLHHKKQQVRIQQQSSAPAQLPLLPILRRPQTYQQPLTFPPAFRPEATGQVFRSSEEVNIPLTNRRPQYAPQKY